MVELLLSLALVLLLIIIVLLIVFLHRHRHTVQKDLDPKFLAIEKSQERAERMIREEFSRNREETISSARIGREETSKAIREFSETNEHKLERLSEVVDKQLKELRNENTEKLEQMRATVDEKLHATLETRLGESFKLVSDRLELVHKGLGEMQTLATGVSDLKKVFSNIKTRGGWAEIQLGNLLEQMLSPDQYAANVATNPQSAETVEYAIRLPGRDELDGTPVWLPIDAKFPLEDYQRMEEAQEAADTLKVEEAAKALEARIRQEARKIREKYVNPPNTTDFAIMYLPKEGLFAEILRRPGLFDELQLQHRVTVMGPTTFGALLNSLQMGFRTLAIEKRSSEVWQILAAVKTEFGKFSEILDKLRKQLNTARKTIEDTGVRTRAMERKLREVEELPAETAAKLLDFSETPPLQAPSEEIP